MQRSHPVYYLLRRRLGVPPLVGLTLDLMLIAPCALVYIVFFTDTLGLIADMPVLAGLVVLLGINSAIAMHLNLKANQLLPVAVFGMMSYLEPVLLFAVSVTFLGEPLQPGANQLWFDLVGVMPDDGKRVDEGKTESG